MSKKILINGKFYTEDKRNPWAEAVAIDGKVFACVGTNDEVIKYAKFTFGEYETIDLGGKTVLPGLIEGHTHPSIISSSHWILFGTYPDSKEAFFKELEEYAKKYPKDKMPYFVFSGYHQSTFDGEGPSIEELDRIFPDRPARINDDTGHGCVYNSMALEMIKDKNGVPYSRFPIAGQTFFKDKDGKYTGRAFQTHQNGDLGVFEKLDWDPGLCMDDANAKDILDIFRHYGDVGFMDAALPAEGDVAYLSKLDKENRLYFYFEAPVTLNNCKVIDETIKTARDWQKKYESDHLRVRTVKFFGDGSNEADDTLSVVPFSNDPEGKRLGKCNFEFEEMRDVLVRLNKERLDFHAHCVCDGTLRRLLDAIETAQKICGDDWCIKVTIAHLEIMHPDDAKRFKKLGVCADITAAWIGNIPYATELALGEERSNRFLDFTQFIKDDICYEFSTDNMSPLGNDRSSLFIGIECAITRIEPGVGMAELTDLTKYPNGRPPESSKFTLEQCIHAVTWNPAERMRILDKLGSIEVGKRACLAVLDKDIFTIPVKEIHTIEPVCTYFDGVELHIQNPLNK